MKSKLDKQEFLHNIKKETDIHLLLEELLPEMDFKDVKITHEKGNKPEYGKDLVCSRYDEIEEKKEWYAFVVKKGTIAGNASSVREVQDQVYECFEYSYNSIEQKKPISISKVKVITNEHLSSGAKEKILQNNKFDRGNIDFWDDEKLIKFIDKYYPKYWIKGSKEYKKYVEKIQQQIRTDNIIKSLNIDNKKAERFLENLITPKLTERLINEDGSVKWMPRKSDTIVGIPDNSIIIGDPGSGKSTLFKTLTNEVITQNSLRNNEDFYPIIITFKEIEQNEYDIGKTIKAYFNKDWNKELLIDYENILKCSNCVIFIDALDELGQKEKKEKALKVIKDFNSNYGDIKIVCSSRPSDYLFHNIENLGFRYLQINELNYNQIEAFLNKFFSDNITKSKSLLKSLKDTEILEKLPKTPLTIALITMLFDEKEVEIPATITDLYENFVNLLIGKNTVSDNTKLIEIGVKNRILSYTAKYLHENYRKSIKKDDFTKLVKKYSAERGQSFDIENTITELIEDTGLLFISNKDEIEFKHLSFQEYFTAYEIFQHRPSDRKLFIDNFNNLWWQNVAIFYGGMSKDAPKLFDDIIKASVPTKMNEYIANISGIGQLLQALYNTPIKNRETGINRGLNNVIAMLNLILKDGENEDSKSFWELFSKYGLMQIFGWWFKHNFWSITLLEPIKRTFDKNISLLEDNKLSEEDEFKNEFQLFLLSSILASDSFVDFERLKQLIFKSKLNNRELLAIYVTYMKELMKMLPKSYKKDEDVKKILRRIRKRITAIPNFEKGINIPIKNKKKLPSSRA